MPDSSKRRVSSLAVRIRAPLSTLVPPACLVLYIVLCFAAVEGPLSGDDHYSLWTSAAALRGDRLNIDVFEPGTPLQFGLSFLGQLATGHRTIGEIAIAVLMKATGLAAVYLIGFKLLGRRDVAIGGAAFVAVMVLSYHVYGADKTLIYPTSVLVAWRYLEGRLQPWALSLVVAFAFLLRHDHGLYIGAAMALTVAVGPRPRLRSFLVVGLGALAVVGPWLAWIGATEGIFPYFSSRIAFARALGLTEPRPSFGFSDSYFSIENAGRLLWQVAIAVSIVALVIGVRRADRRVAVLAATLLIAEPGLMRQALHAKELAILWVPLLLWLVSQTRRPLSFIIVGLVAAITFVVGVAEANATRRLSDLAFDEGGLFARAVRSVRFHSQPVPIEGYASPDVKDERQLVRYLRECLRPQDRVWDTSAWFPLSYYSERNPVWHPYWQYGFRSDEASQHEFLKWIRQRSAPVIVVGTEHGEFVDPFRMYQLVREYVAENYSEVTSPELSRLLGKGDSIRILTDHRRTPTGIFAPLGLPCFAGPDNRRDSTHHPR